MQAPTQAQPNVDQPMRRTGSIRKNFQIDTDQIILEDQQRNQSIEGTRNTTTGDYNCMSEIEDLRVERLPEKADKQMPHKSLLKVIILGDTGVGKTCILTRLTKDKFDTEHNVTIGVEFGSCCMKVEDSLLKLQIWDTAGQESFKSITKIFYRSAHAVFLCYSIANRETFNNLSTWLEEVYEQCYPDVMIFIIGNKQDLESEREVSREAALRFMKENNIKYWTETSAKSGENVEQLFLNASKFLYNQLQAAEESDPPSELGISGFGNGDSIPNSQQNSPRAFGRQQDDDNIQLRLENVSLPTVNKPNKGCKC